MICLLQISPHNVTEIVRRCADSMQANIWGNADAGFNSWSVINDLRSECMNCKADFGSVVEGRVLCTSVRWSNAHCSLFEV